MPDNRYEAPFGATGASPIDARIARRLLALALGRGGDYADLFFEYRVSGSYSYDEGILKAAGRAVTLGPRRARHQGRRHRATPTSRTSRWKRWSTPRAPPRRSRPAAALRRRSRSRSRDGTASRYPVPTLSLDVAGEDKRALLERADRAARAHDPRIIRVEASLLEEVREILIATSDGKMVARPPAAHPVRGSRDRRGGRQAADRSSGGGGRIGLEYFDAHSPESHAEEAVRLAIAMLDAREAPAGEMPVVLAPGRQRHPAPRGGRPRARGRLQPQGHEQLRDRSARTSRASCARSSTTARSRARAARSTWTTRATSRGAPCSSRTAMLRRLHAGPALRRPLQDTPRPATAGARASRATPCRA